MTSAFVAASFTLSHRGTFTQSSAQPYHNAFLRHTRSTHPVKRHHHHALRRHVFCPASPRTRQPRPHLHRRDVYVVHMALSGVAPKSLTVLVVGSGGREHALVDKLSQSPYLKHLLAAPGNPGMLQPLSSNNIGGSEAASCECVSDVSAEDVDAIVTLATERKVDLVVVGPEVPLVAGLVDRLSAVGIPAFGPSADAAQLEGSKVFSKCFFERHKIPTAEFAAFCDVEYAKRYARELGTPMVVKAGGLAAGKGVVIVRDDLDLAFAAIDDMLTNKRFGDAGEELVIERMLQGEELSFFALVDSNSDNVTAIPLGSAQDHKKVYDGDKGPNTGGMGAYSPAPMCDEDMTQRIMDDVVWPTVNGMRDEGNAFTGVLYVGLMVDPVTRKFSVLEYNVRFGDPECQVLCTRLETDLLELLYRAVHGRLGEEGFNVSWADNHALVVVMATQGYPGAYEKGSVIRNIDAANQIPGIKVFHAGTKLMDGTDNEIVASGGRVLGITATGPSVEAAQKTAYKAVDAIDWPQGFCRRDIGWRAIQAAQGTTPAAIEK